MLRIASCWEQEKGVQSERYEGGQETSFDFCYQATLNLSADLTCTWSTSCTWGAVFTASDRDMRWDCCCHQVRLYCLLASHLCFQSRKGLIQPPAPLEAALVLEPSSGSAQVAVVLAPGSCRQCEMELGHIFPHRRQLTIPGSPKLG